MRKVVSLTEGELKILKEALGEYKKVLKSKAARMQHKHGYRDDSKANKRYQQARTAQDKLSDKPLH